MAFNEESCQEDAEECPVCYECLSGTERTLSCGHVFCHDCLVKTLVTINGDGNIKDTLVCPVCRHLTFIRQQKEALVSIAADKDPSKEQQTLEVPLPLPLGQRPHRVLLPRGGNWISHCFRGMSSRFRRQSLINPRHKASQIFIISAQGRPMDENDALSGVITMDQPHRMRRRRICTTTGCLVVLLSAFTLLAVIAATLPWILLA